MLTVGIPREVKPLERRVGLTPEGVGQLKKEGVSVVVERDAGLGSGYADCDYRDAGAEIVEGPSELYERAGFLQKVKEPQRTEWKFLKPDLVLCSYLHLASPENRDLVEILLNQCVTAIGFETVSKNGRTILLEPMSEIAGRLAAYYAPFFKAHVETREGKILYPRHFLEKLERIASRFPELPERLPPVKAVVYGGGVAGRSASEAFLRMGCEVDLIEKREVRRHALKAKFQQHGSLCHVWSPEDDFRNQLSEADVWVGCVHMPGERAPLVLTEADLRALSEKRPKLILDVAADQGGNFPGARSTAYDDPLYMDSFGNLRFGVSNIPSLCGRAASEAIEKVTLSYTVALAKDWKGALREFAELRSGLQVFAGKLVNEPVACAHQRRWQPFSPVDLE